MDKSDQTIRREAQTVCRWSQQLHGPWFAVCFETVLFTASTPQLQTTVWSSAAPPSRDAVRFKLTALRVRREALVCEEGAARCRGNRSMLDWVLFSRSLFAAGADAGVDSCRLPSWSRSFSMSSHPAKQPSYLQHPTAFIRGFVKLEWRMELSILWCRERWYDRGSLKLEMQQFFWTLKIRKKSCRTWRHSHSDAANVTLEHVEPRTSILFTNEGNQIALRQLGYEVHETKNLKQYKCMHFLVKH